jgi:hypothetical protein
MENDITLKQRYLAVNFIGLVMMGAVFFYAALVGVFTWWLPEMARPRVEPQTGGVVKSVFAILALATFFGIKLLQKLISARSVQLLPQAAIMTFALSEAVALLGLVLFFLTGQALDFFLFMFLSLFYFYFFFPKYQDWEARLADSSPAAQRQKAHKA